MDMDMDTAHGAQHTGKWLTRLKSALAEIIELDWFRVAACERLQPANIVQLSHKTWSCVHKGDGIVVQHHDLVV